MKSLSDLLEISARGHSHLCPRQILGVRIGLRGIRSLQLEPNQNSKRLLVISEADGCFVDGISAATNCTIGHRTLRVEDYGKTAATFVDTHTETAIRVAPAANLRQKANLFARDEPRHYFAQMAAYQTMPDEEMMVIQEIILRTPIGVIISRPRIRVDCESCGEEIMNEREIQVAGSVLCRTCIGESYYHLQSADDFLGQQVTVGP
jgi:formylmethanofuran dehydrogenase subunit E